MKGVIFIFKTKFENLDFFKDQDPNNKKPFTFVVRDREVTDGERFVLAGLSEKEARNLCVILGKYFD